MTQHAPPDRCPVCQNVPTHYIFTMNDYPVWQCNTCKSAFLHPQPDDAALAAIYTDDYFLGGDDDASRERRQGMKRATARQFLAQLHAYYGDQGGKLLEIGCGQGEFLVEAESMGFKVTGIEISEHAVGLARAVLQNGTVHVGELQTVDLPDEAFDVIVSTDVIEHVRDPHGFMQQVHRLLKPGGVSYQVTISLDTWTARVMRHNWMEFKTEHLTYFTHQALETLMFQTGFEGVRLESAYKILTPRYIHDHFERYPVPVFSTMMRAGYRLLPQGLRQRQVNLTGSGVVVMARKVDLRPRHKLSIVMPAYNESSTVAEVIDRVLDLKLDSFEKELIIIESNSTDGTREIVQSYADHPSVKLILQDKPKGKGFAVREGFKHATGDFILIQDADLEYDVNDYLTLLEPLVRGETAFVLGSRHTPLQNSWNMRKFEDDPVKASVMNLGHVIFATLLNLMYRQRLRDPFTMYKVFRRDCLDGLRFESNRFDFDFELVIKLLRKGYKPIEVPVSYQSRGFDEGKKVSMLRDPLTWIVALVKFRFSPLYDDKRRKNA